MLIVADINTVWRRKPFEALTAHRPVLGVSPIDPVQAWRQARWPVRQLPALAGPALPEARIVLPPSWASALALWAQPYLWRRIVQHCRRQHGQVPTGVVVTSPHYEPLLQRVPPDLPTLYYASDDYLSYGGWDPDQMRAQEERLVQRADRALFVSDALAERARAMYDVPADRIDVSMNATEPRFLSADPSRLPLAPPAPYADLERPIVGVVGGINDRLDFDLLRACANLRELGTLLFVGPRPGTYFDSLRLLEHHPRCVFVGHQPHATIPQWMHCLDVALIPYRETPLNRHCSPMRLFDHLASGRPIVATEACRQVTRFTDVVTVAPDTETFCVRLRDHLRHPEEHDPATQVARAQSHTWASRAARLHMTLCQLQDAPPADALLTSTR